MVQHVKRELQSAKSACGVRSSGKLHAGPPKRRFQPSELENCRGVWMSWRRGLRVIQFSNKEMTSDLSGRFKGHLRAFIKGVHWWPRNPCHHPSHRFHLWLRPHMQGRLVAKPHVRNHPWNHLLPTNDQQKSTYQDCTVYSNALIYTPLYPLHKHAICSKAHQQPVSWSTHGIPWCNRSPQTSPNPLRNPGSTQASENQNGKPQHNEDG